MKKSKIVVDTYILDKISESRELTSIEKINFLKYVWYLTISERRELSQIL